MTHEEKVKLILDAMYANGRSLLLSLKEEDLDAFIKVITPHMKTTYKETLEGRIVELQSEVSKIDTTLEVKPIV